MTSESTVEKVYGVKYASREKQQVVTIIGHPRNLRRHLYDLAASIDNNDPGLDWPEWRIDPNLPSDGTLIIRLVSEFDEDDDPTILYELKRDR